MASILRNTCLGMVLISALQTVQAQSDLTITGTLRIKSLDEVAKAVSAFAQSAFPEQANNVNVQVGQVPITATQLGLDPKGEIIGLLLDPSGGPDSMWAAIATVTDVPTVVKSLNLQPSEADPTIYTVSPKEGLVLNIAFEGSRALVAPSADLLKGLRGFVQDGTLLRKLSQSPGHLNLEIKWGELFRTFRPMMEQGIESSASTAKAGGPSPAALKAQLQGMLDLMEQAETVSLQIEILPDAVKVASSVNPVKDSELAGFLKADPGATPSYAGLVNSSDFAMAGWTSFKLNPKMVDAYLAWMTEYLKLMQTTTPEGAKIDVEKFTATVSKIVRDFSTTWDGSAAFEFMPLKEGKSFIRGAYGITDVAKAKSLIDEVPKMNESMKDLAEASGAGSSFKLESTSKYGEADIYTYTMTQKVPDMQSQKAMELMGMSKTMPMIYALTSDRLIITAGEGAAKEAENLVDAMKKPMPPITVKPAQFGFNDQSQFFMTMALSAIVGRFAAEEGVEAPAPTGSPGVALAGTLNGIAEFQSYVSAAEVRKIADLAQKIEAKKKGAGSGEKEANSN